MGHNRKSQDPWPRAPSALEKTRHQAPTHVKGEESDLAIPRGGDRSAEQGWPVPRGQGASVECFGCSDNWASVTHLEHGLSRRPTQSMGLQIEAKEGASVRRELW